jgi:hypothetical protein
MAPKKNWIKSAIKKPGSFSAAAKRAGMSTQAYARKKQNAGGKTGRRAKLALTLAKLRKRK